MQSAEKDQCTQCTGHNNVHNILVHSVHSAFDTAHFVVQCTVQECVDKVSKSQKMLSTEKKRQLWQNQVLTCFRIQLGGSWRLASYSRHFDMI